MSAYQVETDPTKVMGRRVGAYFVDVIIGVILFFIVAAATVSIDTVDGAEANQLVGVQNLCALEPNMSDADDISFCLDPVTIRGSDFDGRFVIWNGSDNLLVEQSNATASYLVALAYFIGIMVIWQGLSGMTLGKAAFGIRTVSEDGSAPGIGRAFVRWILWIVDLLPCYIFFLPLVGGITAVASKGHRRVGDMAAKTYVVDKGAMGRPVSIPGVTAAAAAPFTPAASPPPPGSTAGAASSPTSDTSSWPTASNAGWGAPDATEPTVADTPAPEPGAAEPQWDAQRGAYIQWDQARGSWLQFDQNDQTWKSLE